MQFHLNIIVVMVLQQVNRIFTQGIPISPCPKIFQYRFDGIEWFGMLAVRNLDFTASLQIKVTLSIRGKPTTSYLGEIELLSRGQYHTDEPVLYKVKFPKTHFPPKLQQVTVNNFVICVGHSDYSVFVTQIQLEHIRKFTFITNEEPPDKLPELTQFSASFIGDEEGDDDNDFMQSDTKFSGGLMHVTQVGITPNHSELLTICGETAINIHSLTSALPSTQNYGNKKISSNKHEIYIELNGKRTVAATIESNEKSATDDGPTTPLVLASETLPILLSNKTSHIQNLTSSAAIVLQRGDWPWLAAIYVNNLTSLVYQCAGTLVSRRVVISSAHCFHFQNRHYKANEVMVFLGRYNLRRWNEEQSIAGSVSDIFIHPDFDVNLGTYDADIAVVLLKHKVSFNIYIRPACLWSGESQLKDIIGERGYIVGWGVVNNFMNDQSKDEIPTIAAVPRIIVVPIVSEEVCFASNPNLFTLTSNRTFCAGLLTTVHVGGGRSILRAIENAELNGPCAGDSGAGLLLRKNNRWMLRGIVSATLPSKHNKCITGQYVIYADVAKFLDWVIAFTI